MSGFTDAKISIKESEEGGIRMCRATEVFVEKGIEQGTDVINRLNKILLDTGRLDDLKRSTEDKEYQKQLIEELVPEK